MGFITWLQSLRKNREKKENALDHYRKMEFSEDSIQLEDTDLDDNQEDDEEGEE